ncbi:hypothetical protein JTB14_018238 [Gonioctena quinquepunctata]|nr:hypothetical protein JTB14_018238 [Gonioctena quinquepunctata]
MPTEPTFSQVTGGVKLAVRLRKTGFVINYKFGHTTLRPRSGKLDLISEPGTSDIEQRVVGTKNYPKSLPTVQNLQIMCRTPIEANRCLRPREK